MADWSQLPKDLVELIIGHFETSSQIVQFRSVCSSWRSLVPPPGNSRWLGIKTHIPFNVGFSFRGRRLWEKEGYCTLIKIPIFLITFETPFGADYILAMTEMRRRKSGEPMSMTSPLTCNGLSAGRQMLFNSLTSRIIPLGHYDVINFYQIVSFSLHADVNREEKRSERAEFLELDSKDVREFLVLSGGRQQPLIMFTSRTMSWTEIADNRISYSSYQDMVAFKGKFYVIDSSGCGQVSVIEPSSEITEMPSAGGPHNSLKEWLVESGEDLFLVQRFTPGESHDEHMYTWFRVFKLDGEGRRRKWVQVNDLKDRVIFLGWWSRKLCCSAPKLPGAKENCIVFTEKKDGNIDGDIMSILVYDLRTRRTSRAFTECRGFMGAFGGNLESLVHCGVILPNPAENINDLFCDYESGSGWESDAAET